MSVPIIASAWNYFHKIPKQSFTEVIMQSIAMSELIKDFDEKDKKRLLWLRDNTHTNILQSMFILDRYVDETKGEISNKLITFKNSRTFNQDTIQKLLCIAVQEIYQIIYKNFKDYKIEEKMGLDNEEQNAFSEGW